MTTIVHALRGRCGQHRQGAPCGRQQWFEGDLHADLVQAFNDKKRVGVLAKRRQHLRADGDGFLRACGGHLPKYGHTKPAGMGGKRRWSEPCYRNRKPSTPQRHIINGRVGSHDGAARWAEQLDRQCPLPLITISGSSSGARSMGRRSTPRRPRYDCRDVQRTCDIHRHPLRTAKAAKYTRAVPSWSMAYTTSLLDVVGPETKSVPSRTEGEMVGGDARLERGEDEDLPVPRAILKMVPPANSPQ